MNARRFGVSTICAMFSRVRSKTSGRRARRGTLDLVGEGLLLGREVEVHRARSYGESDGSSDYGAARTVRSVGDDAVGARAGRCVGVVEAELVGAAPRSVCSPTHGTRVSGPSAIFDSFTGLPGTSTGSVDAVGARHLDEHVARRDVRVGDHVGARLLGAGGDARRR